jgi:glutamyl-tRNA synthetase
MAHFYLSSTVTLDPRAASKFLTPATFPTLRKLHVRLATLTAWTDQEIARVFAGIMEEEQLQLGQVAQPVRVALTGGTVSPGIFEVVAVLGRERTLARLERVLTASEASPSPLQP